MRQLLAYAWPGNVRELANVVERAMVLSTSTVITSESLPELLRQPHPVDPLGTMGFVPLDRMIEHYVARVLEHTAGNHTQAARILGISRRTLHRMAARKRSEAGDGRDILSHEDQI